MKIGIIGAGNIGGTLGKKWAQKGHEIMFGVRNPEDVKVKTLLEGIGGAASAGSVGTAIAHGEVILLATPAQAVEAVVAEHGAGLDGKIAIDATNHLGGGREASNVALIQESAPGAIVARAFNSLGWENFEDPMWSGVQTDLFYCSPPEAQATMEKLISEVGLHPIFVGGMEQLPLVDNLGLLWINLVFRQKRSRRLAFKLLTD